MNRLVLFFFILFAVACTVSAQSTTQVGGIISDATGAVIPNAKVELDNVDTGLKRASTAGQDGHYSFQQVTPGAYRITCRADGFQSILVSDIRLLVNNPATVNIRMEVGSITDSVSVTAEAVQVNTTDASIGNAVGTKAIVQLPLNARNIVGLLALQPGVVFTTEGDTNSRNGAVNGGKSDQANVTLDGVDVNDQMDRNAFTSVLRMTPDSVQEFRVTTMNANAESGRTSGAQVALVTKSGTNDLHGSLYEYHRNTVTSANDYFNNASGVERPKLIRNIFGASTGGPVIKNRLFLFGNYEGRRDAKDGSVVRNIPSMDMRQGILHYSRKDGSMATVTPADLAAQVDPKGVSASSLKLFQSYPVPNDFTVGDNMNLVGYRFKAPTPLRWNTYIARADYLLDSAGKHTAFLRGNLQNDHEDTLPQFPGLPANSVTLRNNKGFAGGVTSVFRPELISNFRYGFTRQGNESTGAATISATSFRGIDDSIGLTRGFSAIIPVHTIAEDLNWTKGSHLFQFGGTVRIIRNRRTDLQNAYSSGYANASWLVDSGAQLSAPFTDMATSNITLFRYAANDVLGLVTEGTANYNYRVDGSVIGEGNAVLRTFAAQEYEMYAQDTWKVSAG